MATARPESELRSFLPCSAFALSRLMDATHYPQNGSVEPVKGQTLLSQRPLLGSLLTSPENSTARTPKGAAAPARACLRGALRGGGALPHPHSLTLTASHPHSQQVPRVCFQCKHPPQQECAVGAVTDAAEAGSGQVSGTALSALFFGLRPLSLRSSENKVLMTEHVWTKASVLAFKCRLG